MTADGWPAILGTGAVRYLAGWPDEAALDRILAAACAERGIAVTTMPDGLRQRVAGSVRFLFNYNAEAVHFEGVSVPGAGVDWRKL